MAAPRFDTPFSAGVLVKKSGRTVMVGLSETIHKAA